MGGSADQARGRETIRSSSCVVERTQQTDVNPDPTPTSTAHITSIDTVAAADQPQSATRERRAGG